MSPEVRTLGLSNMSLVHPTRKKRKEKKESKRKED